MIFIWALLYLVARLAWIFQVLTSIFGLPVNVPVGHTFAREDLPPQSFWRRCRMEARKLSAEGVFLSETEMFMEIKEKLQTSEIKVMQLTDVEETLQAEGRELMRRLLEEHGRGEDAPKPAAKRVFASVAADANDIVARTRVAK